MSQSSTVPAQVSVQRLTKRFHDHVVLEDVSLDVGAGEVVAIIGPSGAGKSTFLRCINVLERAQSGSIRVGEHQITMPGKVTYSDLQALRRAAGMVFQSFNLFPHMTVRQNVTLAQRKVLGSGRGQADERAEQLVARVGLSDKIDTYPAKLSGGQQQRIAIARALAIDPEVMLFDEPTSALDPEIGLEVLAVMRELAQAGMTMIVVTHEMEFARQVADRIVVMADGGIVEQGPSEQLLDDPRHERTQRFLSAVIRR